MRKLLGIVALYLAACNGGKIHTKACEDTRASFCRKASDCSGIDFFEQCMKDFDSGLCEFSEMSVLDFHKCSIEIANMDCENAWPSICKDFKW